MPRSGLLGYEMTNVLTVETSLNWGLLLLTAKSSEMDTPGVWVLSWRPWRTGGKSGGGWMGGGLMC